MMQKQPKIVDLESALERKWNSIHISQNLKSYANELHGNGSALARGFTVPTIWLLNSINWLWLMLQNQKSISQISQALQPVINRAVSAVTDPHAHSALREEHESFLLQLALLLDDQILLQRILQVIGQKTPEINGTWYLYYWNLAVKHAIEGNRSEEQQSWNLMIETKYHKQYAWPSKSLVQAFSERNASALERLICRDCEKHWKFAQHDKALKANPFLFFAENKHAHSYWPWVEAAFLRMAQYKGLQLKYTSFWLPEELSRCNTR